MTKIHPRCKFATRVYICTGVYIVHMNEALVARHVIKKKKNVNLREMKMAHRNCLGLNAKRSVFGVYDSIMNYPSDRLSKFGQIE